MPYTSQGNKEAYEKNIDKWSRTCFSILSRPKLKQDFYDLACMILIYGCVEKKGSDNHAPDLLSVTYSSQLNLDTYFSLLDRLCVILDENDLDFDDLLEYDQLHFWSFKFLDFYFSHVYEHLLTVRDELFTRERFTRSNLFNLLNYKIVKLKHDDVEQVRQYLSQSSLDFLINSFVSASSDLLTDEKMNVSIRETRLLANCLADLLTFQEGVLVKAEIRANLRVVQRHEALFTSVCELFREVHAKSEWKEWSSAIARRDGSTSLKCELVRLIGILVFENERTQNALVQNGIIYLLSANLDVDVDNPFLREWTIVALRHVLCAHDRR